ncbi:MAG: hypothetical protein ACYTE3_12845 [Planctomycetota bacterium]|jgi:hypothetical protein
MINVFLLWILKRPFIWWLDKMDIVDLVYRNDAAIIFREDSVSPEEYFPWHLRPEPEEDSDQQAEVPGYLAAAMQVMFIIRKEWLMAFVADYMSNPDLMDAKLAEVLAEAMAEESEETVH